MNAFKFRPAAFLRGVLFTPHQAGCRELFVLALLPTAVGIWGICTFWLETLSFSSYRNQVHSAGAICSLTAVSPKPYFWSLFP